MAEQAEIDAVDEQEMQMRAPRQKREPEFDQARVRDISEAVYRDRLGPGGAERMVAKDGDSGEKLRERAGSYDSLTRSYLRAIECALRVREFPVSPAPMICVTEDEMERRA